MTEKMAQTTKYPFCALVGQEMMKEAIVLNMIDPGLGGVLIRGQKGTAKTTAVRGIPDLMPDMKVVEIPANATEDRVAGSIDIEAALKDGESGWKPDFCGRQTAMSCMWMRSICWMIISWTCFWMQRRPG